MSSARGYVNIQVHVRDAAAVQSFMNLRHQINATEQDLNALSTKSGRRAKSTTDQFMASMRQLPQAVAQFAGIGSALGTIASFAMLVRREYEAIKQVNMKAGQVQFDTEKEFRSAAGMLAIKGSDISEADLKKMVMDISSGTGIVGPGELFAMSKPALSARGPISARETIDLVGMVARTRQEEDLESRNAMVSGSLALRKAFDMTNKEAFGLIQGSIAAARPEEMQTFARNLVPTVAQLSAFGGKGDTPEDLAALIIGMGQRAEDPTSRRTSTGVINAVKQVVVQAKAGGIVGRDAGIIETFDTLAQSKPGSKAATMVNQMAGIFSSKLSPEEYQAMTRGELEAMPELTGEARTYMAMLELLDPKSVTNQQRQYARSIIPGRGESFTLLQERQARLNAITDPGSIGFQTAGALKPTTAQLQLSSNRAILERMLPDIRQQLLLSGAYATETDVEDVYSRLEDIDVSPQEILGQQIRRLRRRRTQIETGKGRLSEAARGTGVAIEFDSGGPPRELSEREELSRQALTDSIDRLVEIYQQLADGRPTPVEIVEDRSRASGLGVQSLGTE